MQGRRWLRPLCERPDDEEIRDSLFLGPPTLYMRRSRIKWFGLFTAMIVVAVAVRLYSGSYGDCKTDADCPPKQECMRWSFYDLPWWASGMTYRTCETPCHEPGDCPAGYGCWSIDHGPGPKAHCMKQQPSTEK